MIFLKSVFGGVVAVFVMWIIVVSVDVWRMHVFNVRHGVTGLGAVAGGWNHLLHMPVVLLLLTAAFGVGLYLTAR
jgi:hypothetical protein